LPGTADPTSYEEDLEALTIELGTDEVEALSALLP
jgi:hypothetical protein